MYKEGRDVLEEETREIEVPKVWDIEEFGTLDNCEETIALLRDTWWPQAAKPEGDKLSKKFLV